MDTNKDRNLALLTTRPTKKYLGNNCNAIMKNSDNCFNNKKYKDENTILRIVHNKENPFVQVDRNIIQDANLSPACRWLIIYLLCLKNDVEINLKEFLADHLKQHMSEDEIENLITEALDSGFFEGGSR
jgi:hypothetical protein